MTARHDIVAIVVFLAACGEVRRNVVAPELDDAAGIVAVVHGPDGARVTAVNVRAQGSWRVESMFESDANVDVDLLVYDCPLERWLASTVDLSVAETGGRTIPSPTRIFTASSNDDFKSWTTAAKLPDRTERLRFDFTSPKRCHELMTEAVVPFGTSPEDIRFLIAVDEDRAIVGLKDAGMSIVARDGTVIPYHPEVVQADVQYVAGFRASNDSIYLLSTEGCLVREDDETTLTPIDCLPSKQPIDGAWHHIDGEVTSAGLEVYVLADKGEAFVMRAGTNVFEEITPPDSEGAGRKAAVLRVGPNEALFAGTFDTDIVRWVDGEVRIEPSGIALIDRVNGLGASEMFGPLMVTNLGDVQLQNGIGDWRRLGGSGVPQGLHVLEIDGRVFVAGNDRGIVAEVGEDGEPCPAELALAGEATRIARTAPDRFILAVRGSNPAIPELQFIRAIVDGPTLCQ